MYFRYFDARQNIPLVHYYHDYHAIGARFIYPSLVIASLSSGEPKRYSELRRKLEGISQRMLTLTLKGLEQDGLVTRTMYPTIPPRVDYELTPLGRKLVLPLQALYERAVQHRPQMLAAREKFQSKQRKAAQRDSRGPIPGS